MSGLYLPRVCVIRMFFLSLGTSGPICEWAVSALSVRYMFLLSFSMTGPICDWAVSASRVCNVFLLSLSA